MTSEILIDTARFSHFIGFALGIGAGSFADFSILRKINTDITSCDLGNLETVHKIVWAGLTLLWISGLAILYARTGFAISEFSPKLITKLSVVMLLTLNAFLLGLLAMPILRKNLNRPYIAFSLEHKTILSLLAAVSICSWISGLILGAFSILKPANFDIMIPLFVTFYALSIFGSVVTTIIMHIIWERRISLYKAKKLHKPQTTTKKEEHAPNLNAANTSNSTTIPPIIHGNA